MLKLLEDCHLYIILLLVNLKRKGNIALKSVVFLKSMDKKWDVANWFEIQKMYIENFSNNMYNLLEEKLLSEIERDNFFVEFLPELSTSYKLVRIKSNIFYLNRKYVYIYLNTYIYMYTKTSGSIFVINPKNIKLKFLNFHNSFIEIVGESGVFLERIAN